MDDYNKYVTAVNKIFDYISKMRIGWPNTDNINYLDSIEEFKNAVTSNAEAFKKAPDPSLMVNEDEEATDSVETLGEQPPASPVEQVPKLEDEQQQAPPTEQQQPEQLAPDPTSVEQLAPDPASVEQLAPDPASVAQPVVPQIPNLQQNANPPVEVPAMPQQQPVQQVPSIPQLNVPTAQASPVPTLNGVPGQAQ